MTSSETNIQQQIRIASYQHHCPLLRNNSGACRDDTGRLIRYGLGNDSAKINAVFKSSDLIGIRRVTITPEMVGQIVGLFWAVEVKKPGWSMDKRARAQQNFGDWVQTHGGLFQFATGVGDVKW